MAVAKYTLRQSDPFENGSSINRSIFYQFQRRKLFGEQDGDKFSKKRISYQSSGGDVVIEAKGSFIRKDGENSWSKPSHEGIVKKITYKYTDPVTGFVSSASISKISLEIGEITSGDDGSFAELMFAGNDKIKIKGLVNKLKVEKTGFDALDEAAVNRGLVLHPFKSYAGDDKITVSGDLRVGIYGGSGIDEFTNSMTKKSSVFPEISIYDAELGESMKIKGLNDGWDLFGGETSWSIYKEGEATNSGRIATVIGAKSSEFDIF
tara:strand:+ start:241 stop:1032 length:792 start_codon:yes stop_codon:yes gene_type:complete